MEPSEIDGNGKLVGASVRRKEDFRLIQGEGQYAADIQPRDVAEMMVLRSPHAHARIRHINVGAAQALPGVLAVITDGSSTPYATPSFRLPECAST